ncbi:MAG: alpha subunit of pyruvate dehydrogenase [Watsoniomyces obsoletus]|nr:MAG: alpha subunit of pyruvate dehydrogenase [Watsoniomyces obsoletus]
MTIALGKLIGLIRSLLAGALPLSFALSPSQIRLISTVGVGVLVGTSLVVIIPEGVETLYSAGRAHEPHSRRPPISTPLPQAGTPLLVRGIDSNSIYGRAEELNVPGLNDLSALPGPVIPATIPDSSSAGSSAADSVEVPATKFSEDQNPSQVLPELGEGKTVPERSPHAYIGISLLLGFVLMYLIDKIPQHAANGVQGPRRPHHISLANLAQGLSGGTATGSFDDHEAHVASPRPARTLSTTIGLVIHAAADGIALGASTSSSNMNLGFMVFLAIMFHKAPAAFGLTSVLLKQGMGKRRARSHLLIFSLAAPVGALTTWSFVNVAGRGRIGADEETQWWTGILLLFSAGTFL